MRGDRQNHMHSARSPWLRAGLSITYSFMDGEILEIKKSFKKSNGEILEIKKSFEKSNGQDKNQNIIILVILLEHRTLHDLDSMLRSKIETDFNQGVTYLFITAKGRSLLASSTSAIVSLRSTT